MGVFTACGMLFLIHEARFHLLFVAPYRLRITYTFAFGAVDCSVNHAFSRSKSWECKLLNLLATYLQTRKISFLESIYLNGKWVGIQKRMYNSRSSVNEELEEGRRNYPYTSNANYQEIRRR